ncbi:MAG TPA: hypothetical protein DDY21_04225 [Candidatus Moranbacteria bacterium]|nr:hypothetical protein [Candidatus Moranbacteria bacterium]
MFKNFLTKLFEGFLRKERYECKVCDRHILSVSTPLECPDCKAKADKIKKVPPKPHPLGNVR